MAKQKASSIGMQLQETQAAGAMASPTERMEKIAVAAYYLAEQRGFSSGQEMDDWLRAEKEIDSGTAAET